MPFQTHQRCAIEYFPSSITDGMICAGEYWKYLIKSHHSNSKLIKTLGFHWLGEHGKDSCQGDSGGPMVHFDESGEAVST